MENTKLQLQNNYVLIKPSQSYDSVNVGGVDLKVGYIYENRGRHVSITGTVISLPETLTYLGEILKETFNRDERQSIVDSSLQWYTTNQLQEGDTVLYNYMAHSSAYLENRIVNIDGYGDCYLISYDSIHGYSRNGEEYKPINGYVFFKRDAGKKHEAKGSLDVLYNPSDYQEIYGTVVFADGPVREYLHPDYSDFGLELNPGDRILVKPGHGFRIAYDIHASEELKALEVIRRPYILAVCV
ncbi:hypothetical protein [Sphingobacterium detergens]|uniref:hypothetical protein n=1 Tax=Sphingobacterium detergens TaxID=1145106 RepID=UPI003AAFA856